MTTSVVVDPQDVARVLQLIAEAPNKRQRPLPVDIPGRFDFWFDGGACAVASGASEFVLLDGTRLTVWVRLHLHICIQFPGGARVEVIQRPSSEEAEDVESGDAWIVE